jgi:hypothetical protein
VGLRDGRDIDNSRFGEFNSRLGQKKFPVQLLTGIWLQIIDIMGKFWNKAMPQKTKSRFFPVIFPVHGNLGSSRRRYEKL